MQRLKSLLLVWSLLFLLIHILLSQEDDLSHMNFTEEIAEYLAEKNEGEIDLQHLVEDLAYFYKHPIDINNTCKEELEKLYLLNEFQILSLLEYIRSDGGLLSIYELTYVYGFTSELAKLLAYFIKICPVKDSAFQKRKWKLSDGRHTLYLRSHIDFQKRKGYNVDDTLLFSQPGSDYYPGDPVKYYIRYDYNYYNRINFGFTAENDAGEEFFENSNASGFDFYSFYVELSDFGAMQSICLGDYHARFGQGLVLCTGRSFGKSMDIIRIRRNLTGLRRYTSVNESGYLRGLGTTISLIPNLTLTLLYSNKNLDASISKYDTTGNHILEVSSILTSGLHRTPSEMSKEKILTEQVYGGNVTYQTERLKFGITSVHTQYNIPMVPLNRPYNLYRFEGTENTNVSFDYHYLYRSIIVFGEHAIDSKRAKAMINGLLINVLPEVYFSVLYRSYDKNFYAAYGDGFSESTCQNNEQGIYTGITLKPIQKITLSAYYDMYSFPWLKYGIDKLSCGNDYACQLDYRLHENVRFKARIKREVSETNSKNDSLKFNEVLRERDTKYRFQLSYALTKDICLSNRIEVHRHKIDRQAPVDGFLIYQDITYHAKIIFPLDIHFRYSVFDTDDYQSRIYAYEHNVPYVFEVPAFYDEGSRMYLMCRINMKNAEFWFKYSTIVYTHKESIGTGLDKLQGNVKSGIKLQLRLRF